MRYSALVGDISFWHGERELSLRPEELTWPEVSGSLISEILTLAGTTATGVAFGFEGAARAWTLVGGVSAVIAAFVFRTLKERRRYKSTVAARERNRIEVERILVEFNMLDVIISEATDPKLNSAKRAERLAEARKSVLIFAQRRLGPVDGVSVNYFEVLSPDKLVLSAADWGRLGGTGKISSRKFTRESPTLQAALKREGRLVTDTTTLPEAERGGGLRYGSFAVAPVYAGDSLFGVLTVDAEPIGGLTGLDKELLVKYASSLATIFVVTGGVASINIAAVDRTGSMGAQTEGGGDHR